MFTLNHCVSARSFRVLWMLEQPGLSAPLKPAVAASWQRLRTRTAFQRALQARAAIAPGVSTVPTPATPAPP